MGTLVDEKEIKIEHVEIEDDGERITIRMKHAPRGYKYIFLNAVDLPQLADMSEDI